MSISNGQLKSRCSNKAYTDVCVKCCYEYCIFVSRQTAMVQTRGCVTRGLVKWWSIAFIRWQMYWVMNWTMGHGWQTLCIATRVQSSSRWISRVVETQSGLTFRSVLYFLSVNFLCEMRYSCHQHGRTQNRDHGKRLPEHVLRFSENFI